jgi:hypothetical protein
MEERQYLAHPLRALVKSVQDNITSEVFSLPIVNDTPQYVLQRERISFIAEFIDAGFKSTPHQAIASNALNGLHQSFAQVAGEVNNYVANQNPGHLSNAASHVDACLQYMWKFPQLYNGVGQETLPKILDQVRRAGVAALANVDKTKIELSAELLRLKDEAAAQAARVVELTRVIDEQKSAAMETSAKLQLEFNDRESIRKVEFESLVVAAQTAFTKRDAELEASAKAALAKIEATDKEADDLLGIIGNKGVTTNFRTVAEAEAKQANTWRNFYSGPIRGRPRRDCLELLHISGLTGLSQSYIFVASLLKCFCHRAHCLVHRTRIGSSSFQCRACAQDGAGIG